MYIFFGTARESFFYLVVLPSFFSFFRIVVVVVVVIVVVVVVVVVCVCVQCRSSVQVVFSAWGCDSVESCDHAARCRVNTNHADKYGSTQTRRE